MNDVVEAWSTFLVENATRWLTLIEGVTPMVGGCGLIYELESPLNRPGEDFAIADMRSLPYSEPHHHINSETEIYFVIQGSGTVAVDDELFEVGPQDVVVTPPGSTHFVMPHDALVLGVVNTPPFQASNYVVSPPSPLFIELSKREVDIALAALLEDLTESCGAWAGVLLTPNLKGNLLSARARYQLPADWALFGNFLDSGSDNAKVFRTQETLVINGFDADGPPGHSATKHRMTASAVIPVAGVGTLELLADTDGFTFTDKHVDAMEVAGAEIRRLLRP